MGDDFAERLMEAARELREEGKPWHEAFKLAQLDELIKRWPSEWGDDLQVRLYGDIEIQEKVDLPDLGITIAPEKSIPKEGSFVFGAPYAYVAKVRVSQKDMAGLFDGINRVEKFLSAWRMTEWGGAATQYWCHFFQRSVGIVSCLDIKKINDIKKALSIVEQYTDRQQTLIYEASWWLRQYETPFYNNQNPSVFNEYLSYWNAFECLTEAVCDIYKPAKRTKKEKDRAIQDYEAKHKPLKNEDIDKLYNEVVNPGLRGLVKHALTMCFGVVGDQYYAECFTKQPKDLCLYQVRNDIAHGNIVEYDFKTRLRVERAHQRLWMIVTNMLAYLTHQRGALDREVSSCYTCANFSQGQMCRLGLLPQGKRYRCFTCRKYEPKKPK